MSDHDHQLLHELRAGGSRRDAVLERCFYRDKKLSNFLWNKLVLPDGGTRSDWDDLRQDTMIHFVATVSDGRFRGECSLHTWYRRIAINVWLNQRRKIQRHNGRLVPLDPALIQEAQEGPHLILVTQERRQWLRKILSDWANGGKCLELLSRWSEGLSPEEIMNRFGYKNLNTAENATFRCRELFRKFLDKHPALKQILT